MIEWARPFGGWPYVVAALGLVVLTWAARRYALTAQLKRWRLFAPRVLVLGALLLILLDPVRRSEFQLPARPAQVLGLVDCSRSMALDAPLARIDQAKQAIQTADGLPRAADQARLSLYRFGSQLAAAADVYQLAPLDESTQLGDALEKLPTRFSREAPRGVVVFSDGVASDLERLAEVAAGYQRLKIPLHVFPVGDARIKGDVAVQDLVVPRRVDANTKATIRGVLRCDGFAGERVVVQVRSQRQTNSPPLATLPLTLVDGEQPFELVVEANPDLGDLVLEAPPLVGEVTARNNQVPFRLGVRGRKIRVVYLEGTGNNEYRWLRDGLLEDPDIECLPILVDAQYAQRPRLMRVDDPYRGYPTTREELLGYDVVICSDISRGAFTKEQLDWTVELVQQRGGGFAMVGGHTSFGSGGWDQTVWDQLIPVDMSGGQLGQGWVYHQFNVRVPVEAEDDPIWRIVPDKAQNRRVLDAMPPFTGTNYMQRLKPGAKLLAVSSAPLPGVGVMPIFASQTYGRGRTFAFAPDTTADWGRYFESQWGEGDNRYFRRFWRNVVRWLSENSINGSRRLHVETDRVIYRPGQMMEVSALAFDEKLVETTAYQLTARLKMPHDSRPAGAGESPAAGERESQVVPLTPAPQGRGYVGQLPAHWAPDPRQVSAEDLQGLAAREVEVTASVGGKEIARGTVAVRILADSVELRKPRADRAPLEELARATGGQVLRSAHELRQLLQSLPATRGEVIVTKTPLWDKSVFWFVLLGLLSVEWIMRRLNS